MGHKHSRDDILTAAVDTAFATGLSSLSFGRVAKRLGISDRTVVYYFPTKSDLVGEVLVAMGVTLQGALGEAFT
ncbi:MAG: TetR/AcrR family transcriptional regulator, partial [Actinomycetota bacterium]